MPIANPFLQFFFFFKLATLMQDEANNSMQSFSHIYLCALRVRCFILPIVSRPQISFASPFIKSLLYTYSSTATKCTSFKKQKKMFGTYFPNTFEQQMLITVLIQAFVGEMQKCIFVNSFTHLTFA